MALLLGVAPTLGGCTALVSGSNSNPGSSAGSTGSSSVPGGGASGTGSTGSSGSIGSGGASMASQLCTTGPAPGPAPIRRLTRFELNNTLRDLLGDTSNAANQLPAELIGN
ncbi:MAG TPA: DUF1587 domain-containing protein, partial [Polyangiaceae bacterium]